jgi:superoxide dismutase, Fe-Mn family
MRTIAEAGAGAPVAPFVLPPLKFAHDALEPVIDAETMRLHHDEHHRAYVDATNAALAEHPEWLGRTIEDVLAHLEELPEDIRQTARDQGGGHANHQFFWKILTPGGTPKGPTGDLLAAIERDFGSFEAFRAAFEERGTEHLGSGWAFLVAYPRRDFRLGIVTLPNQDSLLTLDEPSPGLLACDLWEHAYYLRYNNRRADWLKAWWGVINWPYVGERYAGILAGRKQL